tara:strand:+ start:57508 stop:62688 length:5181 start_codon:yes stop_codon:yes gene_type:complete
MSININGNKIVKFGKNLPTVYIDKISVELTQITVDASCYFAKPADVSDASFEIFYENVLKSVSFTSILLPENAADSDFTVSGGTVTSMPIYDEERVHFSSDEDELLLGKYYNGIFQDDDGDYGLNIEQALKREPTNIWHLIRALRGYGTMDSTGTIRGTTVKKGFGVGKKVVFPIPDGAEIEGEDGLTTYPAFLGMFFENAYNTLDGTDTIYDDGGNEVIRCRLRKTFSIANKDFGEYNESRSRTDGPMLYLEAMFGGVEFTLACFTTTLEFDAHRDEFDFLDISRPGKATPTEGHGYTRADLYTKQISDVTYETVSTNGRLASIARPIFKLIDTDTVYTEGDVLQAIDSLYYADDGMKRSDILDVFKGLVTESEATINAANNSSPTASDAAAGYPGVDTSELATLQEAIDNLKVILQVNGHKVDFLPMLRLYEKTFPETSTVTPVGDFYERFQSTLLNVNSKVKTGTQLVKSINLNTVVVDLTATTVDGYSSYFDTAHIAARTPDHNGAYVKAAVGYSTTAAAYAGEERDGEPMVSAPYTGPTFYCTYTDPNKFELYPSNTSLRVLLETYGLGTELFYELNFDRTYSGDSDYSSSPSNVATLATACEQIVSYDFLQVTGQRFGSAAGWVGSPFPLGDWGDLKVEHARQLLSCLAHNFITSTYMPPEGEDAGALEKANNLLHDLIAMAMTTTRSDFGERVVSGISQRAFAPGTDLYNADAFFTNVYASSWGSSYTSDSGKVNVRFRSETGIMGNAGYSGAFSAITMDEAGISVGAAYGEVLNALINTLGGYTDTNFGLLYNHMVNLFSSKASMLLSEQLDFLRSGVTGAGVSENKLNAIDKMLTAVRNSASNICALYGLALCYEFTKTMQEKGSQYQITDLNGYMFGYWWFDFEHALTKKSLISYIYHLSNVEAYFGKPVTSETFKVTEATVRRYHQKRNSDRKLSKDFDPSPGRTGVIPNADNLQLAGKLTANFDDLGECVIANNMSAPPYPPVSSDDFSDSVLDFDSMGGEFSNSFTPSILTVNQENVSYFGDDYSLGVDFSRKSGEQFTYLVNRAFQLPSKDLRDVELGGGMTFLGDEAEAFYGVQSAYEWTEPPGSYTLGYNYRLMCFEHQEVAGPIREGDVVTEFEFPYSFLQHEVKVTDTTGKVVAAIVDAFMNCYNGDFKNFIEQAMEDCNYNEYDGKFNDFYIEKVMSEFGEDASEAPWVKMCVLYHLHRDLVYNTYGGDKTILMDAVLRQLEKISPTSGTLDQIIAFDNAIRDFIDVVYIGDSSVESSICKRLVDAGFEPYTRINGTSTEGGLGHRTINLLFQNGGSTTARESDAVSPEFCEMYNYIPEPINFINTISDGQVAPLDLYTAGIIPIADFARFLTSYYCVEGHVKDYSALDEFRFTGDYLFEEYRDFYQFDTIDMFAAGDFLGTDIPIASYVSYAPGYASVGDHSRYSRVVGPTIALHLIDILIEFIQSMEEAPEYSTLIKDSERIDYLHKHALMTLNEGSTIIDVTSRAGVGPETYEGIAATFVAGLKKFFRESYESLIHPDMFLSDPRGLVFKAQYANRAGLFDPDSRYMTSPATLRSSDRVYGKQWLNQYYLDHATLCDNLVGVFLGVVCIMAKRTERFVTTGQNPESGADAGIVGLLNLKVEGNTLKQHVREIIASQGDQYAVKSNIGACADLPYTHCDFWRPQSLRIFQGVYKFADGQGTIQEGYDIIDEFERASDSDGVFATT